MIDNSTFFLLLFLGFFLMDEKLRLKIMDKVKQNKKLFLFAIVAILFLIK